MSSPADNADFLERLVSLAKTGNSEAIVMLRGLCVNAVLKMSDAEIVHLSEQSVKDYHTKVNGFTL